MSLFKLFTYTILSILPFHTVAIDKQDFSNLTLGETTINNYKEIIINCHDECCVPVNSKFCSIFYNTCLTEEYKNGIFIITKENLKNSQIVTKVRNNLKKYFSHVVVIIIDRNIYFSKHEYINFKKELINNSNILEKSDKFSNRDAYQNRKKYISKKLSEAKKINCRLLSICLFKNDYNNIYNVLNNYTYLVNLNKQDIIKTYHKDKKLSCINRYSPINSLKKATTIPNISSVIINKNNLACCFSHKPLSNNFSENKFSNHLPIVITVSIVIPIIIVFIASIFIYKKYKKSNLIADSESLQPNTKIIENHIYEEPDDTSIKKDNVEDHLYIKCLNDYDTENTEISSNNNLANMEATDNDTIYEQSTIVPTEGSDLSPHLENELPDVSNI